MKYILFIVVLLIVFMYVHDNRHFEYFESQDPILVIARYHENLEWLKETPFSQLKYIVYNKGNDDNYYKSNKFIKQIKLENVGRESHSYISHIIDNYDKLNTYTIFFPGSIELENRHDRAAKLVNDVIESGYNKDIFACVQLNQPVYEVYKDFTIDNYLSSNELNKRNNNDANMHPSDVRPFSKWYETIFGNVNIDTKCFTQNSMFGIKKDTILSKPRSYYEKLLLQVNKHHNHETVHYFERSWETVFHPLTV